MVLKKAIVKISGIILALPWWKNLSGYPF